METNRNFRLWVRLVFISVVIGVGNELTAYITQCWIYHPWWMTFVNLALMFAVLMPNLAFILYNYSLKVIYLAGFFMGLFYEFLDQYCLHWASFPSGQFLMFSDINTIREFIALLWGLVPLVTVLVARAPFNSYGSQLQRDM